MFTAHKCYALFLSVLQKVSLSKNKNPSKPITYHGPAVGLDQAAVLSVLSERVFPADQEKHICQMISCGPACASCRVLASEGLILLLVESLVGPVDWNDTGWHAEWSSACA